MSDAPRLAVRAIIVRDGRLLLVNAYPDGQSDLWCAPGGGAIAGQSLAQNLKREVFEETGLTIEVGPIAHVAEFQDPTTGFDQVDLFLRATATGQTPAHWRNPEGVVVDQRFFTEDEIRAIRLKPDILPALAFGDGPTLTAGLLETKAP